MGKNSNLNNPNKSRVRIPKTRIDLLALRKAGPHKDNREKRGKSLKQIKREISKYLGEFENGLQD